VLRTDFVSLVHLRTHRVEHEIRLPAEQAHAEAIESVHVLVAIEVPDLRALRTFDHDLVDDFLELRPETVHHAGVREVRAMRHRVVLGFLRARDVPAHEGGETRLLTLREIGGGLVDARDGAESLLHVVGLLARVFLARDGGCGRRRRGRGRARRGSRHRPGRHGRHGRPAQQCHLRRQQLHLLLDEGLQQRR
jgi:hypothetical protein